MSRCCRVSGQHRTRTADQNILFSHVLLSTEAIYINSHIFRKEIEFLSPEVFIWDHTLQMLLSTHHDFSVQDVTEHDVVGWLSVQAKAAKNISVQTVCLYGILPRLGKFSVLLWSLNFSVIILQLSTGDLVSEKYTPNGTMQCKVQEIQNGSLI